MSTLATPSDDPLKNFAVACSKAHYPLLRRLYARGSTARELAEAKGVTVQAISPQLKALMGAGLVRAGIPSDAGAVYEPTDEGRDVFELVSGIVAPHRARIGWVVAASANEAAPEHVTKAFHEFGGETFPCAGDIDYVSFFPSDGHDLAIALASRVRETGAACFRALVLSS